MIALYIVGGLFGVLAAFSALCAVACLLYSSEESRREERRDRGERQ